MSSFAYEDVMHPFADEDFVLRAREGDLRAAEFLMLRYRPLVESKAKSYFLAGADHDDVVQEGMIGLFKAIRDFNTDRRARFRPFAELCVTRQIITAVKTATRQKHNPLNISVSLFGSVAAEDGSTLLDVIPDEGSVNPEEAAITKKANLSLNRAISNLLSELEARVLQRYLEGKTYREISGELHCHQKSIDNALQRIKKKIHLLLQE